MAREASEATTIGVSQKHPSCLGYVELAEGNVLSATASVVFLSLLSEAGEALLTSTPVERDLSTNDLQAIYKLSLLPCR